MKKKIAMLFFGLMTVVAANAQFEQGKMYANAGLSGLDLNYTSKWDADLSAKVGYMFMQDWMLVGEGQWNIREDAPNSFQVGAGLRYYIEQNGLFLSAGARYKHDASLYAGHSKHDDLIPNISLGYAFFLSRTVTIEPELYYDISLKDFKDYSKLGFRVSFGIYLDELF